MSQIISFSTDKKFANGLDSIIEKSGYQNRSRFLRDASLFFADMQQRGELMKMKDDEILESIAITGTPDEVSSIIYKRYGSIASRIAPSIFSGDPQVTKALITALKQNNKDA